jgi:hypothetical protein
VAKEQLHEDRSGQPTPPKYSSSYNSSREFDGKSQDRYAKINPKFFLHDFLPGQFGSRIDFSRYVNDSRHFASEKKSLIVLLDVVGLTVFRQKKWKRRQGSVQLGGISGLDELF